MIEFNINTQEVQTLLTNLGNLEGREIAWVQADLKLAKSNALSRFFWTWFAKHFSFTRKVFYNVDLNKSCGHLEAIRQYIIKSNDNELRKIYMTAINKFNVIAPNHTLTCNFPIIRPKNSKEVGHLLTELAQESPSLYALVSQIQKTDDGKFNDVVNHLLNLNFLIAELAKESPPSHETVSQILKTNKNFFEFKDQEIAQEIARTTFKKAMKQVLGSEVEFINASGCAKILRTNPGALDENIFSWKQTDGVQFAIATASLDPNTEHFFSAASQYNCTESPSACTPLIGNVMNHSEHDYTQGPLAQRTNPVAFELVNAYLTHGGYNMMAQALPASVGKTYETGEKKAKNETVITHGYLKPGSWGANDDAETIKKTKKNVKGVVEHLESHLETFETVCYSSIPVNGGPYPVHIILSAAPCLSGPNYPEEVNHLQYLTALANFATSFKQLKKISEKNPEKKVVFHATLPGLGVFGNDPINIAGAFRDAALYFQDSLSEEQKKQIKVEVNIYKPNPQDLAMQAVNAIGLEESF